MKTLAIIGGILAIPVFIAIAVSGIYNGAIQSEKQIVAQYDNMKNVLGQYSLKVAEAAQVPNRYRDDLTAVYSSALEGRYGADGSKAVFQFIQEHNPNFDSALYTKIQTIIEAGRDKFENQQTQFIDIKRGYETRLNYLVSGTILRALGFPRIKLEDYKIIESRHGKATFETGIDEGVKF